LDKALSVYEETLKLLKAKVGPEHRALLATMKSLAGFRAQRGQFAEAAADLVRVREVNPDDHEVWHQLAALLVASGQFDVYREHCRSSVERFGSTADPHTAERIAKDCLSLPDSGADLDVVAKMADTAAAVTNHRSTPWFQLVKGLAEYRQGRFAGAVEWTNKVLTETGKESERDVGAYMVLAMAHHQLKQTDEARAALDRGAEIERTKLPKLESGNIGGNWLNCIIAHALMREAKALIEGNSQTKAETK
jgi:Flp pilus assembly protein TadD